MEPPDPIPNSAVKRVIADGSVGLPHVRVGHRQALNIKRPDQLWSGRFFLPNGKRLLVYLSLGRLVYLL